MTPIRVAWAAATGPRRREVADALLGDLMPTAEISRVCPRCGGGHGAPLLTGTDALASATYVRDGMNRVVGVVVAVKERRGLVGFGIDAQAGEPADPSGVLGVDTLRDWVRIEAAAKAEGRGLRADLARVTPSENGWTAAWDGADIVRGRDLDGPTGVLLSAAWRTA